MRFAANLNTMFTGLPLPERFEAARRAGFECVELTDSFSLACEEVSDLAFEAGLEVVHIQMPVPDGQSSWNGLNGGEEGIPAFEAAISRALEHAGAAGVRYVSCPIVPVAELRLNALLKDAAVIFEEIGVQFLVEPVSQADDDSDSGKNGLKKAADFCRELAAAGKPAPGLLLDFFHAFQMGFAPKAAMDIAGDVAEFFQASSLEHRVAPDAETGQTIKSAIRSSGFDPVIGCEYREKDPVKMTDSWMADITEII